MVFVRRGRERGGCREGLSQMIPSHGGGGG